MSDVYEVAHDRAVHHRVALSRYSTHLVRRILAQLNRVDVDIVGRLAATSGDSLTGQRLEALLAGVRAIQSTGWALVQARLTGDLTELVEAERDFAARLARTTAGGLGIDLFRPEPSVEQVMAAVQARPFQGRFLRDWLSEAEEGAAKRVRETIRQGFIEGQTVDQMVKSIRGTKALRYKDGALEISRRGAEAMVRTAVTHTANVAAQNTWEALGVAKWRFVATLDNRTTLTCASLHGKTFDVGKGPQPPRHVNCRSTSIAVPGEIPGVKPFEFPTYEAWLRRQSAAAQDDILGQTKGRLFRQGGLKVESFVDNKGRELTLEQLKARNASAFEQAGLQ